MSQQPRYWKKLERHDLSAEYPDIKGKSWDAYVENLRTHGIVGGRKIILHEGKVIDGWQLLRACIEADVKPTFAELKLPSGMTPEEWVETVNDHRRQETMDVMKDRAEKRRERVAVARAAGQSTRTIAAEEKVSEKTIRNDIDTIAKDSGADGTHLPTKTTGSDGKEYPASRPKLAADMPKQPIPPRLLGRNPAAPTLTPTASAALPQTSAFHVQAQAVIDALGDVRDVLQDAVAGSDSVLRSALEKQGKKLGLVLADIDLILGKVKPGKFTPPSVEDVAAYSKGRGGKVDAEKFHSYYSSNGWKVGKNPMKDWQAAVRTWENNGANHGRVSRVEAPAGKYANVGQTLRLGKTPAPQ